VLRVRSVDDYEPANLQRQAEYFGYLERGRGGLDVANHPFMGRIFLAGKGTDPDALAKRRRLLDLTGSRFVLTARFLAFERLIRDAGYRVVAREGNLWLYENPFALPRAFVTYRMKPAPPPEELLARLAQPGFDPRVQSYVEGAPDLEPAAGAPPGGGGALIVRESLHEVEIAATLTARGYVVLADSYYPGWRAFVDDQEVTIHPVNHLFRGVATPPGAHRIRFEYRPMSFRVGLGVSAAGLAVWGSLALSVWRRRSKLVPRSQLTPET
jgi:hypothetical protein